MSRSWRREVYSLPHLMLPLMTNESRTLGRLTGMTWSWRMVIVE